MSDLPTVAMVFDLSTVLSYAADTESVAAGELVREVAAEGRVIALPAHVLVSALTQLKRDDDQHGYLRVQLLTSFDHVELFNPVADLASAELLALFLATALPVTDQAYAAVLALQQDCVLITASKDLYHSLDGLDVIELEED